MFSLYRAATRLLEPILPRLLARRLARGKEDPTRMREKLGYGYLARPDGPLVWLHGASVGEAVSALPLITALKCYRADLTILVTTGTRTSAELMARRLPDGVLHQFAPLDAPGPVGRFLDHWRPDTGVILESELWPNLLWEGRWRGMRLALVNARLSAGSFRRWRMLGLGHKLLSVFDICLAQDSTSAERLLALGAPNLHVPGNLKLAAAPLPANPDTLAALRDVIGDRPIWLAASTHQGEERMAAIAHQSLIAHDPRMLLIVAPRHPERGADIAHALERQGLTVARRGDGSLPTADSQVYVADTMGELGLWYRLAPVAFVGGSLVVHGGQNPLEPARLGAAIVHGPHTFNFAEIYTRLDASGGAQPIHDAQALPKAVLDLLNAPEKRQNLTTHAAQIASDADHVVDRVMAALRPFLPPALDQH